MSQMIGTSSGGGLLDVISELGSPEFQRDPYPLYRRLRAEAPLYEASGRWLVSRHRDCDAVLRDERWERTEELMCLPDQAVCPTTASQAEMAAAVAGTDERFVLDIDIAPSRARLRGIFIDVFSARLAHRLGPRIQDIVDDLLDEAVGAGELDFVDAFALPLPIILVCELLGVPYTDRERFQGWSQAIVRSADPLFTMTAEEVAEQRRAGHEFAEYFSGLIAERRARPGSDLLSQLITAEDAAGRLSEKELIAACIMLLVTGYEMVSNFLGLAAYALASHPDQFALVRDDPGLVAVAVEELLRYDSPAQIAPRVALADVELGDRTVRRGNIAVLLVGSANRDPEVFAAPDRLVLTRRDNPHLAFGQGHLYCPGAPLARAQGRIALATLARRVSALELRGRPQRKGTFCIRGLASLPVSLR